MLAEAPETAVIFGMPEEAIRTGAVDEIVLLGQMAEAITRFANKNNRVVWYRLSAHVQARR